MRKYQKKNSNGSNNNKELVNNKEKSPDAGHQFTNDAFEYDQETPDILFE